VSWVAPRSSALHIHVTGTSAQHEGQRRYDLFGNSHGFRRPGVAMFIEPGASISTARGAMWIAVPIGVYQNRKPDPYTGIEGDATFPRFIFLAGYQLRFGGSTP
jgi:hypothetical protein